MEKVAWPSEGMSCRLAMVTIYTIGSVLLVKVAALQMGKSGYPSGLKTFKTFLNLVHDFWLN